MAPNNTARQWVGTTKQMEYFKEKGIIPIDATVNEDNSVLVKTSAGDQLCLHGDWIILSETSSVFLCREVPVT